MEIGKAQIILFLYERSRSGESISADEFAISNPTFHRYIAEIRAFLSNDYLPFESVFDGAEKKYRFKKV